MRILLLAGTTEAREIAQALAGSADVVASLAGATRVPDRLPVPTRIGGFGGESGFLAYLRDERIGAVLDATHPYAVQITERTARACRASGLPYLRLTRSPWRPAPDDRWHEIADEAAAAEVIAQGARVFVATGRQSLPKLKALAGRHLFVRQIDRAEGAFPYPHGEYIVGRAPFTATAEAELFRRLGIDWLLVKNSGGTASWPKLEAARALRLPVAMVRRPAVPEAPTVGCVADALDWVRALP